MSKFENIETLFKTTFDQFEADVNPAVWSSVQKSISSNPVSTGKFSIGKIAGSIGLISIGIAGASLWHLLADKKQDVPNKAMPIALSSEKNNTVPLKNNIEYIPPIEHAVQAKEKSSNKLTIEPEKAVMPILSDNKNIVEHNNPAVETHARSSNTNAQIEKNDLPEQNNLPMPGFAGLIRGNKPYNPTSQKPEHYSPPIANIFSNTTAGEAPLTVEFINNGTASSLNWNFGDGNTSNENAPSHTFTKAGIYTIILTAKTSTGSVTDKAMIEVKQISEISNAPNIFTPNDDGENDKFYFDMKNIASIGVVIFSPKKGVVYDWNTIDGNWNGKLKNGMDAPEGAYFYTLQAIGSDGISYSKKGSVFLKRH